MLSLKTIASALIFFAVKQSFAIDHWTLQEKPHVVVASFSEIDLHVREAVEDWFRDDGFKVELNTLRFKSSPKVIELDDILIIELSSEVKGEQRLAAPYWAWYDCTTRLIKVSPSQYQHLGTECEMDFR